MADVFQNLLTTAARTAPAPATVNGARGAGQTAIAPNSFDAVLTRAVNQQTPTSPTPADATTMVRGGPALPGEVPARPTSDDAEVRQATLVSGGLLSAAGLVVPPVIGLPPPIVNTLPLTVEPATAAATVAAATPTAEPIERPPTFTSPTADRTRADQLRLDVPPTPTANSPGLNIPSIRPDDAADAEAAPRPTPVRPRPTPIAAVPTTPAEVTAASASPASAIRAAGRTPVAPAITPVVASLNQSGVPLPPVAPTTDPVPATAPAAPVPAAEGVTNASRQAVREEVVTAQAESAAATTSVTRPTGEAFAVELRTAEPPASTPAPVAPQPPTTPSGPPENRAVPVVFVAADAAPIAFVPRTPTTDRPTPVVAQPAVVARTVAAVRPTVPTDAVAATYARVSASTATPVNTPIDGPRPQAATVPAPTTPASTIAPAAPQPVLVRTITPEQPAATPIGVPRDTTIRPTPTVASSPTLPATVGTPTPTAVPVATPPAPGSPVRADATPAAATPVAPGPVVPPPVPAVTPVVERPTTARPVEVIAEPKEARDDTPVADRTPVAAAPPVPVEAKAAVATTAAPRPAHVQLAEQVTVHAAVATRNGRTEFQMRLDPPDLGRVEVTLSAGRDGLRAELLVADDGVRRMIESQLPDLRQRLEQAGVTVQRFDVSTGGGGQNAQSNGREWGERPQPYTPPAGPAAAVLPARPTAAARVGGGLDVTV